MEKVLKAFIGTKIYMNGILTHKSEGTFAIAAGGISFMGQANSE
jgi:hypothetical protein